MYQPYVQKDGHDETSPLMTAVWSFANAIRKVRVDRAQRTFNAVRHRVFGAYG